MFRSIRVLDISRRLDRCPCFPGDPVYERSPVTGSGDGGLVSRLSLCAHSGTHVDAPAHILPGGDPLDRFPLERFVLPALVADATGRSSVGPDLISSLNLHTARAVLLRTDNSVKPDTGDMVFLEPDAARLLAERGVGLVGVDGLGPDPVDSADLPAHHLLLGAGVLLLENLDLSGVTPGEYGLICLPLDLDPGAEASPVRAVLVAS